MSNTDPLAPWEEYVDLLKPGAGLLRRTWRPDDPEYRADVYRQLAMNLSYAYFQYFQSDPLHPEFMPLWNSVYLLQPNPDDVYYYAPIDGRRRYRIAGDRGGTFLVHFQFGAGMMGMVYPPGRQINYLDARELDVGADGSFEFIASAECPPGYSGTWHPLDPACDFMMVRLRSYDWGGEADTRLAIECLDAPPLKPRMTAGDIDARLRSMFTLSERWSRLWFDYQVELLDRLGTNTFELNRFEGMGIQNQDYWTAVFDLQEGEALLLESDLPEQRRYWNVQLNDPYFNAVEFVYRQTSLNGHTASVDPDGRFRAVIAIEDPGVANWLDPGGFRQGTVFGRWMECDAAPVPTLTRISLASLETALPDGMARVTPEQRAAALRARRMGAQLRRRW
ncbi:DUF1214 domain-containing protein [Haliea sp. E17]|uniref:DUF1214 domain-containing protein n=1 Tax=Haliea sp. E17 TaxID=3401576 RepID=UPI003AAE7BF2